MYYHRARRDAIRAFERRYIERVMLDARGNVTKAALLAGVDRTTIYRLLNKFGLRGKRWD